MARESVASRYAREWMNLLDDRKVRGYDLRSNGRRKRDFVDPATGNTVGSTNDNSNGSYTAIRNAAIYVPDRDGTTDT